MSVKREDAEEVLRLVAQWMGGAPTGEAAARSGQGPELMMDWDWPSDGPTPTILLEGGPEDWSVRCCHHVQTEIDKQGRGLFLEPYSSFALCIYEEWR